MRNGVVEAMFKALVFQLLRFQMWEVLDLRERVQSGKRGGQEEGEIGHGGPSAVIASLCFA